jgi:hypothetical protein
MAFFRTSFSTTISNMFVLRRSRRVLLATAILCVAPTASFAQQAPLASAARTLLLPRQVVAGERATLAVLDVNGRLTPAVVVKFSNGDQLTTDTTGRALFVAPLNPGIVFASIAGRKGRVPMVVLAPDEVVADHIEVDSAPRLVSITDRLDIQGKGFCGEADANHVTMQGQPALVLAASASSLTILPPPDSTPGLSSVAISCGKKSAATFSVTLLELALEASASPLSPGQHRALIVRVRGTQAKVNLEAVNLAPEVADLTGGNTVRVSTTGGAENSAQFEMIGRGKGNFLISIRLAATIGRPHS